MPDADQSLVGRIRGTAKQTFAYSGLGNDLAAIADSGGAVQATYARDATGNLLGLKEGTAPAVSALSDLHGDLVATYTTSMQTSTAYDPFGTVTARSGAPSLLGYQGAYTGNVNMLARWYQPGTGTFTSRDTATLDPSPSVQANRYTYANASPLTGINPTGHSTVPGGSLQEAGPGYAGCIASDGVCHETFVHERYRSDLVNSPGYDYLYGPGFSKEERERLGWKVMPNGRLVDQPNFWFADADVQEAYMLGWFPAMEQRDRDALWVAVGGMDSMVPMVAAAEVGDDPRVPSCVQAMASNRQASCGDFPNLDIYMEFLQFAKDIAASAKSNGVDKNALMAVLLYENSFAEGRIGKPAWWFGL